MRSHAILCALLLSLPLACGGDGVPVPSDDEAAPHADLDGFDAVESDTPDLDFANVDTADWPQGSRFEALDTTTVRDHATGLDWRRGLVTPFEARGWCEKSYWHPTAAHCERDRAPDVCAAPWRLPTRLELLATVDTMGSDGLPCPPARLATDPRDAPWDCADDDLCGWYCPADGCALHPALAYPECKAGALVVAGDGGFFDAGTGYAEGHRPSSGMVRCVKSSRD